MKILLLSPNYRHSRDWSFELFRDAIVRCSGHAVVRVYGNTALMPKDDDLVNVPDLVDKHRPDLVIVHHLQFSRQWQNLRAVQNIPKVCWVNDYFPRHYDFKNALLREHEFDLVFMTQRSFVRHAEDFQVSGDLPRKTVFRWLPFSVDTDIYSERHFQRAYDVTALFSGHAFEYPNRQAVVQEIEEIGRLTVAKVFARLVTAPKDGVYHLNYARLLSNSRIAVASCDQHGSCNLRHYEIPASGALLVTDTPWDFERLGFIAGQHYVPYEKPADLAEIIPHVLEHWARYQPVADFGASFVRTHHGNEVRVRQMFKAIDEFLFS